MEVEQNEIDALDPQPTMVAVRGNDHVVNPPRFATFLRLQKVMEKSQKSIDDLSDEDLEKIEQQAKDAIAKCVPSLAGVELNAAELMTVAVAIFELGTPKVVGDELAKRGISVDSQKKVS